MLFPKLAEPEAAGKTEGETSEGGKTRFSISFPWRYSYPT